MGELLFNLIQWIKSKEFFATIRLLLNIVFTIGIANFFCENYDIGPKNVLPVDRDNYIDWLVTGNFFLPVIVFAAFWMVTEKLSSWLFSLVRWIVANYLINRINKIQATKSDIDKGLAVIRVLVSRFVKVHVTKTQMADYYIQFRSEVPDGELREFHKELLEGTAELRKNFIWVVRLLAAAGVYLHTIPDFSSGWFWLVFTVCIVALLSMLFASIVVKVLPAIANKIETTATLYIQGQLPKQLT